MGRQRYADSAAMIGRLSGRFAKQISLVSPDLQVMHATEQTGLEMVVSGFYGSVGLFDEPTESQVISARSWFRRLGAESLEDRAVRTLVLWADSNTSDHESNGQ